MPKLNPVDTLKSKHPEIAAEWHPTKNGDLRPSEVTRASNKKVWWLCAECSYEWEATIANRSRLGRGGPACGNKKSL